MHPLTDSPPDPGDEGMTTLDAAMAAPAPAPTAAAIPAAAPTGTTTPATDTDLVEAFDPERLLLGDHGGVLVIAGLLLLAIVLLTVAFGALPR
ncbi:hypothetical protein [Williamsia serinedens]|jgi:hypothetical protein|uniref:Uncharacterized protein n=1 Tax=Williamsia serinedens TaxID=391736 RepID=A0ABT1H5S8_9NOCA|nr:hypothetical protein [Williamsia serinedens]MCP2162309.1 hypothetical protein [Williamsia serinedens]